MCIRDSLCLCFAAGLASCQSPPAAPTLMPGIAEAEQVSLQEEWVWSPEQECAPCHSQEAQTAAASVCTGLSGAPARCLGCHVAEQELEAAHEGIRNSWQSPEPVSYTHLDVYKRQGQASVVAASFMKRLPSLLSQR